MWRTVDKGFNNNVLVKKKIVESNIECIKNVSRISENNNCFAG